MSENKMTDIIRASIDSIKSSFDANTVTGTPITTANGTVIIPVSKLSVGFATGGVDYLGKNNPRPGQNNFGGGGGTGVTVVPVGFLVCDKDGDVEFLNVVNKGTPDPVDQIADFVERTPDIIAKIKDLFTKDKEDAE